MDTQTQWHILTEQTQDVIEYGIQNRWYFRLMAEKGVLEKPILKSDWLFVPIEADFTTLPDEALKRLEAVKSQFNVKQVIVGHEIVVAPTKPAITLPKIPWKAVGGAAVGLAAIGATGALAILALPVILIGAAASAVLVDPQLIIVCGPDETWISICEWLG